MTRRILTNKPLVEAIFELRWELPEPSPGIRVDAHYKILIGSLYDRVRDEYPFHEQLLTATVPDEIAGYIVQHRFRKGDNLWPLIQIGPGIITLNDTAGYVWEDFERRISQLIGILFETYPNSDNLKFNGLLLRYIDAIDFDYNKDNVFSFLKSKMKMDVEVHQGLFKGTGVSKLPLNLDLKFSFASDKPKGVVNLRFARGHRDGGDALIWETMVQTSGELVPQNREEVKNWIGHAHELADDWFFKIIEGDLLRRFE